MKVICINKKGYDEYLTIGKTYDVIKEEYGDLYIIIGDNDDVCSFFKHRFTKLSLAEIRNDKINKLLE